jgi:nicotinamidase-related amidase
VLRLLLIPFWPKGLVGQQVTEVVITGLQSNYCVADSCRVT